MPTNPPESLNVSTCLEFRSDLPPFSQRHLPGLATLGRLLQS
jgi:hypothetical protein